LQASAALRSVVGTLVTEATFADRMFVNDANLERSPGYGIVNARLVSSGSMGPSAAEITLGAQNIFDRKYVSSVNVNAAGGKFYEPGSQRSIYVGVSLIGASRRQQ
jgi:iron complex outermembrane receptor protein